jgi:diacylglycerol kinase (ATP)
VPGASTFIVNPTAGGGRAARLVPWLRERIASAEGALGQATVTVTTRAGDAEALAARAAADGVERVVAAGGDGTVQEVVNGLLAAGDAPSSSLGVLPVGTGNDLARSLDLPRRAEDAWAVAVGGETRRIDIARARNGTRARWFASAGGIGFDAQVAAAMATRSGWQRGAAGYLLTTLSELRRFNNRRIRLTLDDESAEHSVLFVAIANGAYYGGGMRIAPDAAADDGSLDVCIVGDITRMTAIRQLPNLYRGTHVNHPAVALARARRVIVEGSAETLAHLDGEPFGGLPLDIEVVGSRLTVAVPRR